MRGVGPALRALPRALLVITRIGLKRDAVDLKRNCGRLLNTSRL